MNLEPAPLHFEPATCNLQPALVTARLLRRWPLPQPDAAGDKEARGQVLVVGGAPVMAGAVTLAALAALRAGAGKLKIATGASVARLVATAVPEAYVAALPESAGGGIDPRAAAELAELAGKVRVLVIGPGMVDHDAVARLLRDLVPRLPETALVLDAAAFAPLPAHPDLLHSCREQVVLTPHAGEMATLLGVAKEEVEADSRAAARRAAARFRAVVALKGAETVIAAPDGATYRDRSGNVGLATSGSGDTLSGIIAGLLARGAAPLQAAAWGVHVHGRAGDHLARTMAPLGYLARELLAAIPPIVAGLSAPRGRWR